MPPLREHREDIPVLAEHFLNLFRVKYPEGPNRFSPEAMQWLQRYDWPGNVRELKHVIEGALVMASGPELLPVHLAPEPAAAGAESEAAIRVDWLVRRGLSLPYKEARKKVLDDFDRQFIGRKLQEHDGNVSRTAEALGIYRQSLQDKLKKLNLRQGRLPEEG